MSFPMFDQQPRKLGQMWFPIWPATQRSRDVVVLQLANTLSSPSVLSYGTYSLDAATEVAKRIEVGAFEAAGGGYIADGDEPDALLQVYTKELGRRTVEAIKARADGSSTSNGDVEES